MSPGDGTTRLWLVRHPKPDVPPGQCYGASDVPIVDEHLESLLRLLPLRLPRHAPVYSSPLTRCLRLARGLEAAGFAAPRVDARLREMDFGRWEGGSWSEVPRDQIDAWCDDIVRYVPPDGESLAAVAERGNAFVEALRAHGDVIVVTHAGIIQVLTRTLRGLALSGFGTTRFDYGEVVVLTRGADGWALAER